MQVVPRKATVPDANLRGIAHKAEAITQGHELAAMVGVEIRWYNSSADASRSSAAAGPSLMKGTGGSCSHVCWAKKYGDKHERRDAAPRQPQAIHGQQAGH